MVPWVRNVLVMLAVLVCLAPLAAAERVHYVASKEPLMGSVEWQCGGTAGPGGRHYSVGGAAFCVAGATTMAVSVVDASGLPVVFHLRFLGAAGEEAGPGASLCGGGTFRPVPEGTARIEVVLDADPTASPDLLPCPGIPTTGRISLSTA